MASAAEGEAWESGAAALLAGSGVCPAGLANSAARRLVVRLVGGGDATVGERVCGIDKVVMAEMSVEDG